MKKQSFLSVEELKIAYAREKEKNQTSWENIGVIDAIESLSQALAALHEIGVDVHLKFSPSISEEVFSLIQTIDGGRQPWVALSGILEIDQIEHLLVVSTKESQSPVLKIYLAERDYASKHLNNDFRGKIYDLKTDAKAMHKFQQDIILIATENEIIREHDVCNAFEKNRPTRLVGKTAGFKPPRL
jgi:hypothetical protein